MHDVRAASFRGGPGADLAALCSDSGCSVCCTTTALAGEARTQPTARPHKACLPAWRRTRYPFPHP